MKPIILCPQPPPIQCGLHACVVVAITCLVITLTGCTGQSEQAPPQYEPVVPTPPPPAPTQNTPASAISINRAPSQYQFEQFSFITLRIDMPHLVQPLDGHLFMLKIYDDYQHTYLTTVQSEPQLIEQSVNVPLGISRLHLKIQDDNGGLVVSKEISL